LGLAHKGYSTQGFAFGVGFIAPQRQSGSKASILGRKLKGVFGQPLFWYNITMNPHNFQSLAPHYAALQDAPLNADTARDWLQRWSDLESAISEAASRAYRARVEDTTDQAAEGVYLNLIENVIPKVRLAENALEQRFAALEFDLPEVREFQARTRAKLATFSEANIGLFVEEGKLEIEYDKLMGDLCIVLDGQELTLYGAYAKLLEPDRALRERVYRSLVEAWHGVRPKLEAMFLELLDLRRRIAKNAGCATYRDFVWQRKARFDYTPQDCKTFHQAILETVVPITNRMAAQRRANLGIASVRPWDGGVDPKGLVPLKPFENAAELEQQIMGVFKQLSPDFAAMFATLRGENLDLESRKGKGPGGFCDFFPQSGQAYIFMNAVGTHDDVQTMLHEGGHAFHALESHRAQKLVWNYHGPMEFCEVASMGMEMLAMPYLEQSNGGMYHAQDAARARSEYLSGVVEFLPYMACVDAFQHWIYVDAPENVGIEAINAKWAQLHQLFLPHLDFGGLEDSRAFRWQRQSHIFTSPFYYIEYGIAQVGAIQVWRNALQDQANAITMYRHALALGGTASLKELFAAAGLTLAFDAQHLAALMPLVEAAIE
jgi:oligoendopeptidase F